MYNKLKTQLFVCVFISMILKMSETGMTRTDATSENLAINPLQV